MSQAGLATALSFDLSDVAVKIGHILKPLCRSLLRPEVVQTHGRRFPLPSVGFSLFMRRIKSRNFSATFEISEPTVSRYLRGLKRVPEEKQSQPVARLSEQPSRGECRL